MTNEVQFQKTKFVGIRKSEYFRKNVIKYVAGIFSKSEKHLFETELIFILSILRNFHSYWLICSGNKKSSLIFSPVECPNLWTGHYATTTGENPFLEVRILKLRLWTIRDDSQTVANICVASILTLNLLNFNLNQSIHKNSFS